MANGVNIDPRYMTYNKDEVQVLLDKVDNLQEASEENVRAIVSSYIADSDSEPESESEPGE